MINILTLGGGLRVVCERMESVRSVAAGVWVGAGSRYEDASRAGISHFIEHMLFKGTRRRTARQIAEEIDCVGGQINAFTAKDCTCFYTKTLDSSLGVGVDILADILLHSKLLKTDIDLERNVILEEINMIEDSPDELVHDLLSEGVWRGCALGGPILGTGETLAHIDANAMRDYLGRRYVPGNTVIAVTGAFDEGALLKALEKGFRKWIAGGPAVRAGEDAAPTAPEAARAGGAAARAGGDAARAVDQAVVACATDRVGAARAGEPATRAGDLAPTVPEAARDMYFGGTDDANYSAGVFIRQKDTEQVHLCIGFDGVELGNDDIYVLQLINYIFGGGMSSVLFQKIREELGLVYSIYSYVTAYRRAGLFAIYAGMQTEQAARVFDMIIGEMRVFKQSGMTPDLLNRAKEQFKGNYLMGLENPSARMSALGKSELLLGYYKTPEETVAKIEKVTLDEIYNVMNRIFDPDKLAVSAVGRIDGSLEKALKP